MVDNINEYLQGVSPLDVRIALFKQKNFDFITKATFRGEEVHHKKQEEALKILTSGEFTELLYGGAAGGAKSWTGCAWILFSALAYPGTRWFIARKRLKDLTDSVVVTWKKVCDQYGVDDWHYNGQKFFITLPNGSHINLIEVKYQPSDPMFEDLGSTEYTGGWIEEVGEIHPRGAAVLYGRCGRHLNDKYDLRKMCFYTCNPKKNWAKLNFYDATINKTILPTRKFIQAFVYDNPFNEEGYEESLKQYKNTDPVLYKRLYLGDWDYEDNPNQLIEYEALDRIFDPKEDSGRTYITADIARFGSDKCVICTWRGMTVVEILTLDISRTTEVELAIKTLAFKYRVPKNRIIADEDGVGGGVVDSLRIVGFRNASRPIREKHKIPNYRNLQVQCLYHLARAVNDGIVSISADLQTKTKQDIKEELAQIQSKNHDERKLDLKTKSEIRDSIGRSPDYRDALMMRMYFVLAGEKRRKLTSAPRQAI